MNLCKDCKYFTSNISMHYIGLPVCGHPKAVVRFDLVNGNHSRYECSTLRSQAHSDAICGEEGKLWTPKFTNKILGCLA